MRILILIFLAALAANVAAAPTAGNPKLKHCQGKWEELASGDISSYGEFLKEWKKWQGECQGTGFYEERLSSLYAVMGKRAQAEAIVNAALKKHLPYREPLLLASLSFAFYDLAEGKTNSDYKNLDSVESGIRKLIHADQSNVKAHEQLGLLLSFRGHYEEALKVAQDTLRLDATDWPAYRTTIISHARLGQCAGITKDVIRATKLHQELMADEEFMYAVAHCYAVTGNKENARSTLKFLEAHRPDVEKTQSFKDMVNFIGKNN